MRRKRYEPIPPKGSSRPVGGIGSYRLRRILSSPDGFQLIIDHAIFRVPDTPHPHCTLTVRTAQGVSTGALLIALAVGHGGDDLDRPLGAPLHLGQCRLD